MVNKEASVEGCFVGDQSFGVCVGLRCIVVRLLVVPGDVVQFESTHRCEGFCEGSVTLVNFVI